MIYCIGVPKTGTVTMHDAFTEAGLNSCHGRPGHEHDPAAMLLWRAFIEGINPFAYIPDGIEAIADAHVTLSDKHPHISLWPALSPPFLQAVRDHNPDAWIILNTRVGKTWVRSVKKWKDLHERIIESDLPFLPQGIGETDLELTDWIMGFYKRTRLMFKNDPRFIEVKIEDENTRLILQDRLGIEFPWWGRSNVS